MMMATWAEAAEVDLTRQRLVGRSWRNQGQELLKRHSRFLSE
jgi:hypothetical protein